MKTSIVTTTSWFVAILLVVSLSIPAEAAASYHPRVRRHLSSGSTALSRAVAARVNNRLFAQELRLTLDLPVWRLHRSRFPVLDRSPLLDAFPPLRDIIGSERIPSFPTSPSPLHNWFH